MDIKKFEKQLGKINGLFNGIAEDGEINEIEKDLLKSYVLKLYENFIEEHKHTAPKKASKAKKEVVAPVVNPVVEEKIPEPIIEIPEPVIEEEVKPEKPVAKKVTPKAKTATKAESKEGMDALFAEFSNKDLGDKLSQSAIKDLTKAWSINEKIFTIKELFKGDSDKFRSTVKELNELSDYEAAKAYLQKGIAKDFGWDKESKLKKARNFIKLIKRRYN